MIKISIIGSGNVAYHLYQAFSAVQSVEIVNVFSRKASELFPASVQIQDLQLLQEADIFIIAVSDDAIAEISNQIPFSNKLVLHTAGSVSFEKINSKNRRGILYPLQTFSKNKTINFKEVPLCLETENIEDYSFIEEIANKISNSVFRISENQRKKLHLSAVFVCNFVNHLYLIGDQICEENNVPFEILKPLIQETANKILTLSPKEAQTGPALRNDQKTIVSHIEQLQNDNFKKIYELLTESIQHVKKL